MVKMLTSGDIGERNMKGTLFLQLSHVKLLQNKKFKNQLKKTRSFHSVIIATRKIR